MTPTKAPSRAYPIALHLVLAALAVLVLAAARENRELEEILDRLTAAAGRGVDAGDLMPELELTDLDGRSEVLRFAGEERDSVVMAFTTTCPTCEQNLDNWLELHRRLKERYRFVAIGLDKPAEVAAFAERHELPFRVMTPAERRYFHLLYGISGVPQTMVVDTDGRVRDVRVGGLPTEYPARLASAELPPPSFLELPYP